MKREPWAIANTFAYAIRVLNCIFNRQEGKEGWTEDDIEASADTHHLVAEQINSMCSDMMIEDAQDILKMVESIPSGRLCEKLDCHWHHPENPRTHSYADVSKEKCDECLHNQKSKESKKESNQTNNFESV